MKQDFFKMTIRNGDTYKVSRQTFEDTTDLAKYIKSSKRNQLWRKEKLSSEKEKDEGFNDFETFEDALDGLEFGTDIYFKQFEKNIKKIDDFISKREKNKRANYKNDVIGFTPIVPNAIIGNPINMINQNIKLKPFPTAKIILERANSAGIDSSDMCSFYSIIFVLIQLLEKRGIRCEIWNTANFREFPEIVSCNVKLKSYMQPLNIYKLQFPVIASDFFRRIMFRILEANTDIEDTGWTWGYGSPLMCNENFELKGNGSINDNLKEVLDIEDADIFIPSCQWFKYHKAKNEKDLNKAIEDIIQKTNLKQYITLSE